jgi:hypothetical protein
MAGRVASPFYGKLSAGTPWQGQVAEVANQFYGLLVADMAGRVTSPFYSELAASRDR